MCRLSWLIVITVSLCLSTVCGLLRIVCSARECPLELHLDGPLLTYNSMKSWLTQKGLWMRPDLIDFELAVIEDLYLFPIEFYEELANRQQFGQIWSVPGLTTKNPDPHIKAIRKCAKLFAPRDVPRQNSIPTGGSWASESNFERLERRRPQSWRLDSDHGRQSSSLSSPTDEDKGSSQNKRGSETSKSDELFHFEIK